MTLCGLNVLFGFVGDSGLGAMALWVFLGGIYVLLAGIRLRRSVLRGSVVSDLDDLAPVVRWFRSIDPTVTSMIGLSASLSVLFGSELGDPAEADLIKGLGVAAMVLAWFLLHYSFGYRYRVFYSRDGGGLSFPGAAEPHFADFVYFAITVGTSFAASDVNVTTARMRWHVMIHSIVAFFYNAIVLAVAFKILTGG